MSEGVGRREPASTKTKSDGSDGSAAGTAFKDDRKPAVGSLETRVPRQATSSTQALQVDLRCNESELDSQTDATEQAVSSSCEESSIKKRKMNVIYSRRKREKKKKLIAGLLLKSVEFRRQNVRLKIEGRRLEALLKRALQLATQVEISGLQQSGFALSQEVVSQRNLQPCNTIPSVITSGQTNFPAVWPPGSLWNQPSSNTFVDAALPRQMAQILADRQSVASLHLSPTSRWNSGNAAGLHSSLFPSLVNQLSGPTQGAHLLNGTSAMDELIHRNYVCLLLRQGLNSAIPTHPNQIHLSHVVPWVESIPNMALSLPHPNLWPLADRTAHYPANLGIQGPPPNSSDQRDAFISNQVRARLQDLNHQQQLRGPSKPKDNGTEHPFQRHR